ncbi:hypothetical protein QBC46DRAFT_108680 [Diplogelasinospora grovesii]|uniref:Cyclin-dependent kinase n=1 Tax=Diplogelasinospora grovesii TaxID=303347 RepID=A0AAN6S5W6_9PEZI|nr:hypothetical protein QBC46DRAFT_108680 [Diplogelasinospora grovesii]
MSKQKRMMASPLKKQPEVVADRVLKRIEISKMARSLQNRLALASFKTQHGWENLTLDVLEPKVEEEMRRKKIAEGDVLSDSSSSTSDLPYPSRTLMSSPLKAPFFSDAIGSSNGSTGHRKRTYHLASFDHDLTLSSPSKRFRNSPTASRSFTPGHATWKDHHQLAQSSPIKPRRQQHFTTAAGPDVSFFSGSRQISDVLTSPNYCAPQSDDDDDLLPAHSFARHVSPPRTPPPVRSRNLAKKNKDSSKPAQGALSTANGQQQQQQQQPNQSGGEEAAGLLLHLAASPSPANPGQPRQNRTLMEPPSTPPPKNNKNTNNNMALPSSMMTTPGGGNSLFPNTPGMAFDFSDFVHMTPSPAQKPWKTPGTATLAAGGRTPLSVMRRPLTFDDMP